MWVSGCSFCGLGLRVSGLGTYGFTVWGGPRNQRRGDDLGKLRVRLGDILNPGLPRALIVCILGLTVFMRALNTTSSNCFKHRTYDLDR